jgi:hypothetical protein
VSVGAKPELDYVEYRGSSAVFTEQAAVFLCAGTEIAALDRHGVELFGSQCRVRNQQFGDMARVTPLIGFRHHPFIHLEHMQVMPVHAQAAQVVKHSPWRVAAAQGNEATAVVRACAPDLGAQPFGCAFRRSLWSWKHLNAHATE